MWDEQTGLLDALARSHRYGLHERRRPGPVPDGIHPSVVHSDSVVRARVVRAGLLYIRQGDHRDRASRALGAGVPARRHGLGHPA